MPSTRLVAAYANASPEWPSLPSRIVSIWNVEKVVSAPQNPVPTSGRQYRVGATCSANRVVSQASNSVPPRLTIKVAQGQ